MQQNGYKISVEMSSCSLTSHDLSNYISGISNTFATTHNTDDEVDYSWENPSRADYGSNENAFLLSHNGDENMSCYKKKENDITIYTHNTLTFLWLLIMNEKSLKVVTEKLKHE